MARYLETDILAGADISSATAIGAYTCDTDRLVLAQVLISGAAGNGDYEFYATLQISGGGGIEYVLLPKTTGTAAVGETAVGSQSIIIPMRSGDILTVYIDGLAGDIAVNTSVRFFDVATCCPLGTGPYTFTYTVTNDVTLLPIEDVRVVVTSDVAGNTVVAEGYTNALGQIVFYLEAGTFYFWSFKTGFSFSGNPDLENIP